MMNTIQLKISIIESYNNMIFLGYHNYPVESSHISWLLNTLPNIGTRVCASL